MRRLFGKVIYLLPSRREEIYGEVTEISTPALSFYILTAISATIAAYGLLANSTAVVIGAMLVAPLMGPIFGIALGIAIGDRRLLWKAVLSEVVGVLVVIGLAALIGLVPLRFAMGAEVLARTQPTLYDIVIALAAGLAGAYALVNEKVSAALPGVATAVAVVPPLATCGLCIASANWSWALNAFLLFVANFLAIELAAAFVFTIFGMVEVRTHEVVDFGDYLRRFAVSLLVLCAIGVFMTQTLLGLIADQRFSAALEATLSRQVRSIVGARLSAFDYQRQGPRINVLATVLTPREFEPAQVAQVQSALRQAVDPRIHLVIRSLLSRDYDSQGPVFIAEEEAQRRAEAAAETRLLSQATTALTEHLKTILGAQLTDIRLKTDGAQETLTANVRTPTAIEPAQVAEAEQALRQATGKPMRLIVRSILTRDADATRYLYEPEKQQPAPLTGEALKLHRRLEAALERQLGQQIPGASLLEFHYAQRNGRLRLLAITRTPRTFKPAQVRQIQANLRWYINPRIDLFVRSQVGADVAATGYLTSFDDAALAQ